VLSPISRKITMKNLSLLIPGVFLFVLSFSTQGQADSLDLNVNADMARLQFVHLVKRKEYADFGVMVFENKKPATDYALQLGYNAALNQAIKAGVRGIYTNPQNFDVLAVGVGAQAELDFTHNIGMSGHLYYAPGVTSLLDATGYREFAIRLNYYVSAKTSLYVGYRNLQIKLLNAPTLELDDDLHVGLKRVF